MKPHKTITHHQAQKLIHSVRMAYLDDDQQKLLDQHLENCAECRAYAEQMAQLDTHIQHSLQERWPESHPKEVELASKLADILPQVRKNQMKINHGNTLRSLGWGALTILLIAGLAWTIKTLAPLPNQAPAELSTPKATGAALLPTDVTVAHIRGNPPGATSHSDHHLSPFRT